MEKGRLYYWEDPDGNLHSMFAVGGFIGQEKITSKEKANQTLKNWQESEKKGEIELIEQKGEKMKIEDKLIYAKIRLMGARLVNNKEDIETFSRHIKELEEELRKEMKNNGKR